MTSSNVSATHEWPDPLDKKRVQWFVEFAIFYRQFIKNFSGLITPITRLTKKDSAFYWTPAAQSAFDQLKDLFTSAPILKHPKPALPYMLEVDASEAAIGACPIPASWTHGNDALGGLLFPEIFPGRMQLWCRRSRTTCHQIHPGRMEVSVGRRYSPHFGLH